MLWLLIPAFPHPTHAQETRGYSIETIELYMAAGLPPSRIWERYVSKDGITFEMNETAVARLRAAGADDEWIAMLKRARIVRASPAIVAQGPPNEAAVPPQGRTSPPAPAAFSRRDVYPLYYHRRFRVSAYAGLSRLSETSGEVVGQVFRNSDGDPVVLDSNPLLPGVMTYGFLVDLGDAGAALDIELSLHRANVKMVHVGFALDPFVPVKASGFRLIAGLTPFSGVVIQAVGRTPGVGDTDGGGAVEVWNWTYGTDIRGGLAYHFDSGVSVFGEWHYRVIKTYERELRFPNGAFPDELPWPPFGAKGGLFRFGIGW